MHSVTRALIILACLIGASLSGMAQSATVTGPLAGDTRPSVIQTTGKSTTLPAGGSVQVFGTSAAFTATIAGTTMTVSAVSSGVLYPGMPIAGSGVTAGTQIAYNGTGIGSTGTYILNISQTVGTGESMTATIPSGTITYLHFTTFLGGGADWLNSVENSTLNINCDGNPQIVSLGAFLLSQDLPATFNTDYLAVPAATAANNASFNRRTNINFYSSCTITLYNASATTLQYIFLDTTYRSGTPVTANHWNAFTMPLQALAANTNAYNYPQVYALPPSTFTGGGSLEYMEEYFNSSANYQFLESSPVVTADGNIAAIGNGHEDWYSSGYYCNASYGTATSAMDNKWGCLINAGLQEKAATYDVVGYRWWTSNPADNLLFNSTLSVSSANGGNDYGAPGAINWSSLITYFTANQTVAQANFSPVAGAYSGTQSVTLSGGPSGDYICYTTNGSTPVPNGSGGCATGTLYTSAISVAASETVEAVGAKSGYNNSPVSIAAYTIGAPGPTAKTCTNFVSGASGSCTWSAAPAAGEFVSVGVDAYVTGTPAVAVTDSHGDTYAAVASLYSPTHLPGEYTQIFYFGPLTSSITTLTVTLTGGSGPAFLLNANTSTGVAASSPVDGTQCNGDSAASGTMSCSAAITTTVANDWVWCIANSTAASMTVGSGFTAGATYSAPNISQYLVKSAAGALTPTTGVSATGNSTMSCAAFKP